MDYRRASRIAEWTLAALVIGLHLGIFLWPETRGKPQFLLMAAHDAQLLSGVVLILAWTVLGPGKWWLRLGALPVLLMLWSLPWNTRIIPRELRNMLPHQVAIAAAAAIVITRLCGFRVQRLNPSTGPERGAQFSLLGLLVVTTLIGVAIGGLEALRPVLAQGRNVDIAVLMDWIGHNDEGPRGMTAQGMRQLVMSVAVALSAIGGLWIVVRPGAMWLRFGAVALTIPILAVYFSHLSGEPDERTTVATNLGLGLALVAGLTALSVLPLRMLDFRLQRKPRAQNSMQAPVADRSRLLSRAALLCGIGAVLALILAVSPLVRRFGSMLKPPATAFAHWVDPPTRVHVWNLQGVQYRQAILLQIQWPQSEIQVDLSDTTKTLSLEAAPSDADRPQEDRP